MQSIYLENIRQTSVIHALEPHEIELGHRQANHPIEPLELRRHRLHLVMFLIQARSVHPMTSVFGCRLLSKNNKINSVQRN